MRIVGIDEVGRGAWAGPLVAAAVLVDDTFAIQLLNDSKKISKANRTKLLRQIQQQSISVGIGWVSPVAIDAIGLTEANRLAMSRALSAIQGDYEQILIDGNIRYLPNSKTVIGGDGMIPAISAASIVAKVLRDSYMHQLAAMHPGYGFESHVGYGTAVHKKSIELLGLCVHHRRSFKPLLGFV